MIQKTYWSKTSIFATLFVVLLMVGVAASIYWLDKSLAVLAISVIVLLAVMCGIALFFMPIEIRIEYGALTLLFPFRYKKISISDINEAMPFTDAHRMWRLCGSGAFFGWWGWFSAKGVGKFMMYASNLDHLLLIKLTNGKKYVISCTDVADLIRELSAKR